MIPSSLDRRSSRRACRPRIEGLEGRQLMVASLAAIPNITVPQTVGFQLPVYGGASNQTYSVSTDNANVGVSVATGQFLTLNVSHAAASASDVAFNGTLTFQLFGDLTPLAVQRISTLVQQGFYTGRIFHRVSSGFPDANGFIAQAGSVNNMGSGDVNQPGFPFQDEFNQQSVFSGAGQLALANSGRDTNSSQFFITTAPIRSFGNTANGNNLDYLHTIFGQLVSGNEILQQITQVQRTDANGETNVSPVSPITINSATLSDANPNGVLHINASDATLNGVTNVTVTATDPADNTTANQTFQVTAGPNVDANGNAVNERAFLAGLVDTEPMIGPNQSYQVQLTGVDPEGETLTYTVQGSVDTGQNTFTAVQNATATVDANGLVTVTPTAGFLGDINLLVGVRDQTDRSGTGNLDAPRNFDYKRVTLNVTNNSGGARLIGRVLTVTPPPRTDKGANTVIVDQVGDALQVSINGVLDPIRPPVSDLDRVVIFGAKASDTITVTPAVDAALAVTLDGGHGGRNVVQAGSAPTRLHGWFGRNTLTGGPADDVLIGRQGHVRFVQSGGNDKLFAGTLPDRRLSNPPAPTGTFFRFIRNRLTPVNPAALDHQQLAQQRRAARQAQQAGQSTSQS